MLACQTPYFAGFELAWLHREFDSDVAAELMSSCQRDRYVQLGRDGPQSGAKPYVTYESIR